MEIVIFGQKYMIPEETWEKHLEMHPVRSMDALAHNLEVVYGKKTYTPGEIKSVILDEYEIHSRMGDILDQAEEIYDETHDC